MGKTFCIFLSKNDVIKRILCKKKKILLTWIWEKNSKRFADFILYDLTTDILFAPRNGKRSITYDALDRKHTDFGKYLIFLKRMSPKNV